MSSPAELLAMKHAAQNASEEPSSSVTTAPASASPSPALQSTVSQDTTVDGDIEDDAEASVGKPKKVYSINDETAFPALGSSMASNSSTPLKWGPFANKPAASGHTSAAASKFRPAVKSSNTQMTFIIDADQQLHASKDDFFKVISKIKAEHGVNIESTLSTTTNKRTFLLNGPIATIQKAKRDVIKHMTKPIKIEFGVPQKLVATIIGTHGKTLRPIVESTGTKINVVHPTATGSESEETEEDNELFGKMSTITVEGDIEGCEDAKAQILAIVNENTKSLNVRIPVDSKLQPFVKVAIDELTAKLPAGIEVITPLQGTKSSNILVSGDRDGVVAARNAIKSLLESLDKQIVVEEKSVPKPVHQFLDADKIFAETNVLVQVPSAESSSTVVKFVGKKGSIESAIQFGKKLANDFVTDTLDLARSHGGNFMHAKALTAFFVYTKFFDQLSTKYGVKVTAPSYESLANDEIKTVEIQFVCPKDQKDSLKLVRKDIVETVNKTTPSLIRVITDIESFVVGKLDTTVAIQNNVSVVPLGQLAGFGNKILLILQQEDDEFLPSSEEIKEKLDNVEKSFEPLRELSSNVISEVIPLTAEDQKHLQGSTLRLLLNKFEPNTIEIKLNSNGEGPSADEVFLIGYKNEIPKAIKAVEKAIEDVKNYEIASKYNNIIEFPTAHLSKLIGQKGTNMIALQEEFDVKIDVNNNSEDGKKAEKAEVKITGLKSNVDECEKKIQQSAKKWADERTVVLKIDQKYHGKLIGQGGQWVSRLKNKYNVMINFPSENATVKTDEVVIKGQSKGVAKAEEELKELLQYEKENGFVETIQVPADLLPRIIGTKGENIKDISADTGVDIHQIRDNGSPKEFAQFELVGSKKGIKEATQKINSMVEKMQNATSVTIEVDPKWHRALVGMNGATRREIVLKCGGSDDHESRADFRRLLQVPPKGSDSNKIVCAGDKRIVEKIVKEVEAIVFDLENVITDHVEVAKKKHRYIVGPAGTVRRGLEEEFKVRINVPRVDNESEKISVTGSPANVEKAKAKITELTK